MAPSPGSPLLSVKQTVPRPRSGTVMRSRLEQRLDAPAKLTLVVAPAGWGKTSLLSSWAETAAREAALAWLSLDETDDDPVRFWSYVLTALAGVSEAVTSAGLEALPAALEGPTSHALPLLVNELAAASRPHLLVLDDYHTISNPAVHESLEFLLAYLPPTLRIVLSSRMDPPLPLARMRVRGELAELRADDLRFSFEESVALVSAVTESEPDPTAATAVWERTEGWAAGLQLAALALRTESKRQSRDVMPGVMRGFDRHLFDYFTDEVFPALAPRQRELLVRAAPLELLSGSLCDAALDLNGSAAVLAELEEADLFVVALDPEREWYRCHRLLRDALLRKQRVVEGSDDAAVRRRAAGWFEEHGRIDDAVRHLLAAREVDEAARLLTSSLLWFLERGWGATFLALGEQLPTSRINTQLGLNLAHAAEISGQVERVVPWLDVAEGAIDESTGLNHWRSPRGGVLALRASLGTPASQPDVAVELCEEALALETAAGTDRHPDAMASLGRVYGLDGRFEEAVRILSVCWRDRDDYYWAPERGLQVGGFLALFLLSLGRVEELDELLREATAGADAAEQEWGPAAAARVVAVLRLVQGRRSYQRGELAAAREQLEHGLALADFAARPTYVVLGQVFLADLQLAEGHRAEAQAGLVRARELADTEPITPFVGGWLEDAEARIGRSAVKAASARGSLLDELTDREMSILRMLPGTATQREIGAALFLSINTVKAYNKSLYRKLDVGSRQDAVRTARRLGLI